MYLYTFTMMMNKVECVELKTIRYDLEEYAATRSMHIRALTDTYDNFEFG